MRRPHRQQDRRIHFSAGGYRPANDLRLHAPQFTDHFVAETDIEEPDEQNSREARSRHYVVILLKPAFAGFIEK